MISSNTRRKLRYLVFAVGLCSVFTSNFTNAASISEVEDFSDTYPGLPTNELLKLVVKGDELAQHEWANRLALGAGGAPENKSAAAMWFSRSAQRGSPGSASISRLPNSPMRADRTHTASQIAPPPIAHLAEPFENSYTLIRAIDGSGSASSGTITRYIWDVWSDMYPGEHADITDTGSGQARIIFPVAGDWYVRLIVMDERGLINHTTQVHQLLNAAPIELTAPQLSEPFADTIIQSSTPVNFIWQSTDTADSYDFEIFTKGGNAANPNIVLVGQSLSSERCELNCRLVAQISADAGSEIFWRVRLNTTRGSSEWAESRIIIVAQGSSKPSTPTILSPQYNADLISGLATEFVWEHEDQVETYELAFLGPELGGETPDSFTELRAFDICADGLCAYETILNFPAGEQYVWYIRAVNTQGHSNWTVTSFNSVGPIYEAPAAPELVFPELGKNIVMGQTIQFAWLTSAEAVTYNFQVINTDNLSFVGPDILFSQAKCNENICSVEIVIDFPLADSYQWQVFATNEAGSSPIISSRFSVIAPTSEPPGNMVALSTQSSNVFLSSASQTFTWESKSGIDVTNWKLYVGSEPGLNDIAESGNLAATVTNWTFNSLPTDGQNLYVTLFHYNGAAWVSDEFSFVAATLIQDVQIFNPIPDSVLTGATQTFSWHNSDLEGTNWWIHIGSELGLSDIAQSGSLGSNTSWSVDGLPTDGKKVYVRLFSLHNQLWTYRDHVFTAYNAEVYANSLQNPLIQIANMRYEGAFVLSSSEFGFSTLHDAEGGMAFAPPKPTAPFGSIFASGNYARGGVSEWAIPQIVNSTDVSELNISDRPLQSFVDLKERAPDERVDMGYFADLLWLDNQLLYSEHNYYPASNLELHKMGILRDADDLQNSTAAGYFRVNTLSGEEEINSYTASSSSGWMSEIPGEWQSALGGTHLLGPADGWNVEGRFAPGPSVFAFTPEADVLNQNPDSIISSSVLVDYATENPLTEIGIVGDPYINAPSDLWNAMSFVHFGFIPAGSRTLMLVGKQWGLDNDIGYKITQDNGVLCGGPCPFYNSDQSNYYWLIDIKDVIDAKNGHRRFDSIVPYAYGPLVLPFQQDSEGNSRVNAVRGGAYDVDSGMLYLQIKGGDPRPTYELRPVFVAYTIETDTQYAPPESPVWTEINGAEPNSDQAPTFIVTCQDCSSLTVEVSWEVPILSTSGTPIDIDHYRLHFENVNLDYYNYKRNQRVGISVAGSETSHFQELTPGDWRVSIRAISSDGVPSESSH